MVTPSDKLARILAGEIVVISDADHDEMIALCSDDPDTAWRLRDVVTIFNPDRVGTLDTLLAYRPALSMLPTARTASKTIARPWGD